MSDGGSDVLLFAYTETGSDVPEEARVGRKEHPRTSAHLFHRRSASLATRWVNATLSSPSTQRCCDGWCSCRYGYGYRYRYRWYHGNGQPGPGGCNVVGTSDDDGRSVERKLKLKLDATMGRGGTNRRDTVSRMRFEANLAGWPCIAQLRLC